MENVQTKVCPRCGRNLPLSDYSKGFVTLEDWEESNNGNVKSR